MACSMSPVRPLHSSTTVGPPSGGFEDTGRHRSLARIQRRRGAQANGEVAPQGRWLAHDHGLHSHRHRPRHRGQADGARAQHGHPVRGRHRAAPKGATHDGKRLDQGLLIGCHRGRELKELLGAHGYELGESSGPLQSDELELRTVIGSPAGAERARAATRERTRHHGPPGPPAEGIDLFPDAHDFAGDLVTEHGAGLGQLAGEMEVTAADPAPGDPEQRLPGSGQGSGDLGELEAWAVLGEDGGPHAFRPR